MSLCQEGLDCVWGRKYENTIICSMPRCPMVSLRSGNVDRLRKEFIPHGKRGPETFTSVEAVMKAGGDENVGDNDG